MRQRSYNKLELHQDAFSMAFGEVSL